MTAVSIENISKTYPASFPRLKRFLRLPVKQPVTALKNVSFEIEEGEIFGLIGSNGAGKTTLTKIIATLVQPTAGKARVKGFDSIENEVKVRSLIGLATAEQNMLFFARLYGMTDSFARKRIGEIFERINFKELRKRRFSELSTGNKQRLAVARALLPAPPVLLLDEPTRSLDPIAAAAMRELILSLENVSVLLTSHNLSEVEEMCRRVAVISRGEIRDVDTPKNLRLKHRQTQRVKLNLMNISKQSATEILSSKLENLQVENNGETISVSFSRDAEDDLLGDAIRLLTQNQARILDVETEKPTLLDVLESYE